jgi:serine/threonine protein kinase
MTSDRLTLAPGTAVAGYVVERLLGHGGMADVYLAQDLAERRPVALKVLPADANNEPARRERLLFEGRILRSLRHPNICAVYEVGEADGLAFLAMEFVAGETLHDLASRERLSLDRALEIGEQVASALEEARRLGVVHRDLKGSNIMVLPTGGIKVLDFGLAKFAAAADRRLLNSVARTTEPGVVFGTAEFMSPEQALGRDIDHRSDLFSLGVILYELITGRLPFSGPGKMETFWAIVNAAPTPAADLNPAVSQELSHLICRLLEKDPRVRYQTAHQVRADLKAQRDQLALAPRMRRVPRRWVGQLAGSALGVALAVLISSGVQTLSAMADDALDRSPLMAASLWAGSDRAYDLKEALESAVNPAVLWVGDDGRIVFGTHRRSGARSLWIKEPGQASPRVLAHQAGAAVVGRRGQNVYFASAEVPGGIYRTSLLGDRAVPITREPAEQLVMLPDARTIMFTRPAAGGYTLWAVPADGGAAYQLSAVVLPDSPLLSPDGERLAIPRADGVMVCEVPACANPVVWPVATLLGWTPDGTALAHTGAPGSANIWVTRVDNGAMRQITRFSDRTVTSVAWSPNGQRVAVTRQRTLADLFAFARP